MESRIEINSEVLLKEKIWTKLEEIKKPSDLDGEGMIGYFLFNIKAFRNKDHDVFIVYTNSSLYPNVEKNDLLIILEHGIDKGVRMIAERMAKDKLVALKEKLYLNQSRGAFKKVEQNREEIFRHINYMRKIKEKPNVFLI